MVVVSFSRKLVLHRMKRVYYIYVPKALADQINDGRMYTIIVTDKLSPQDAQECIYSCITHESNENMRQQRIDDEEEYNYDSL